MDSMRHEKTIGNRSCDVDPGPSYNFPRSQRTWVFQPGQGQHIGYARAGLCLPHRLDSRGHTWGRNRLCCTPWAGPHSSAVRPRQPGQALSCLHRLSVPVPGNYRGPGTSQHLPSLRVSGQGLAKHGVIRVSTYDFLCSVMPRLTSQPVSPLLRPAVLAPARASFKRGAPCWPQAFALRASFRRRFVEQAEFGRECFSGRACRPVGFAFDCVLGWRVATVCRWALGLCRAPEVISAINPVAGVAP